MTPVFQRLFLIINLHQHYHVMQDLSRFATAYFWAESQPSFCRNHKTGRTPSFKSDWPLIAIATTILGADRRVRDHSFLNCSDERSARS